jgi:hypothetical protein
VVATGECDGGIGREEESLRGESAAVALSLSLCPVSVDQEKRMRKEEEQGGGGGLAHDAGRACGAYHPHR